MGKIDDAAALLLGAHAPNQTELATLPPELRPQNFAEAYAIQRAVATEFGAIGGWKVARAGETEPETALCTALPISWLRASGAVFPARGERSVRIALAVKLVASLARQNAPFTRAEATAAIGTIHPAAELIEPRVAEAASDPLVCLADGLAAGPVVVGHSTRTFAGFDPTKLTIRVVIDNRSRRHEGHAEFDIPRLLAWLGAAGAAWAGGLYVGHVVTVGVGLAPLKLGPRARVRVAIAGLGSLDFSLAPPASAARELATASAA